MMSPKEEQSGGTPDWLWWVSSTPKTDAAQFAMSHESYDLNLGSEILILAGDTRSRSWLNIGGTYGNREGWENFQYIK